MTPSMTVGHEALLEDALLVRCNGAREGPRCGSAGFATAAVAALSVEVLVLVLPILCSSALVGRNWWGLPCSGWATRGLSAGGSTHELVRLCLARSCFEAVSQQEITEQSLSCSFNDRTTSSHQAAPTKEPHYHIAERMTAHAVHVSSNSADTDQSSSSQMDRVLQERECCKLNLLGCTYLLQLLLRAGHGHSASACGEL